MPVSIEGQVEFKKKKKVNQTGMNHQGTWQEERE